MNRYLLALTLLLGAICAGCAGGQERPNVITERTSPYFTNLKVKGSLESKNPKSCVPLDEINNTVSPPDLFAGVATCLEEEDFAKAGNLFFLARLFGAYDAERVADKTAGQGIDVLQMRLFSIIEENKVTKFQEYINNPKRQESILSAVCNHAKSIGHPEYYPKYLILHGIKAFYGIKGNGLEPSFDSSETWRTLLNKGCQRN